MVMLLIEVEILRGRICFGDKMLGTLRLRDLWYFGEYVLCVVLYIGYEFRGRDEIEFIGYFFNFIDFVLFIIFIGRI